MKVYDKDKVAEKDFFVKVDVDIASGCISIYLVDTQGLECPCGKVLNIDNGILHIFGGITAAEAASAGIILTEDGSGTIERRVL